MIRIKRNIQIIYFLIFYTLIAGFLIKNLNLSKSILFFIDVLYCLLLFRGIFKIKNTSLYIPTTIVILLFFSYIPGIILNGVDIGNIVWGIRSQFYSLIIFYATASFITYYDIEKIFKYFFYFQFLNVTCAIYQYYVLGYYQDLNNGAFINGGGQDIFCAILLAYYFYRYINRKCKLWEVTFILISSLYIAAIEEEKFIFIEFAIILIYYFLTSKLSLGKIILGLSSILFLSFSLTILSDINGESNMEVLTNKNAFMDYATMTGGGYGLPRIGSSTVIEHKFFTQGWQSFWGLGIGRCEESSTLGNMIDTTFYNIYGWLHYDYFPIQLTFLQTGWIGTGLYILFFISLLLTNFYEKMKCPLEYKYIYDVVIVIIIICIISIWYNATLRSYNSLIPYFILGIAPAMTRLINKHCIK